MFKEIGYRLIETNNESIRVEDEVLTTDVFVRNSTGGRFHIYIAFGRKYSGVVKYPQLKVFAHHDIFKLIKGELRHIADKDEQKNMEEMFRISRKLRAAHLGTLEYKDRNCAHATLKLKIKNELLAIINRQYEKYDRGKYKKKIHGAQFTISIFKQRRYIHVVCVYAEYTKTVHKLIKLRAIKELNRIIFELTKRR